MTEDNYDTSIEDETIVETKSYEKIRGGLSRNLQRLAVVTGIAQFTVSIWSWQFGIFLQASMNEYWQIGITFSIGTFAMILGYVISGTLADYLGRKNVMIAGFIPMFAGLMALRLFPVWPLIPFEYATIQVGWAFILIMTSAIPADEIAMTSGINAARTFNMVLLPAFLIDGTSPIIAGILVNFGYVAGDLYLLAAIGALVAILATHLGVSESLGENLIEKAKEGSMIALRGLGRNFWIFVSGMFGFVFVMNFAFPYMGNLVVNEWGVSESWYAIAWGAWSFTCVILMYGVGSATDRNIRLVLIAGLFSTAIIVGLFAYGNSLADLVILNILLAAPIVVWSGAEKTLAVNGVRNEMKGRALGTYQFLMSSTRLVGQFIGALLWEYFGSLRTVYGISSIAGMVLVVGLTYALMTLKLEYRGESQTLAITE
ncbi:MAG: MFS transporter [Candidatus Thorarchaeota archaeon]